MKHIFISALFFLCTFSVFSEDIPTASEFSLPESALTFNISGRTRSEALKLFLRWDSTRIFSSLEELHQTVEEARRKLANTRLFETVDFKIIPMENQTFQVEFSLKEPAGLGFLLANTLLLPVVTYDTNTGLIAGAGYQDQNFLGNISEFRLNGEYRDMTDGSRGAWLFGTWTVPLPNEIEPATLFLGFNLGLDISGQSSSHVEGKYRTAILPWLYSQTHFKTAINPGTGNVTGFITEALETSHRWNNWTSSFHASSGFQAPDDGLDDYFFQLDLGTSQGWDFRQYFGFFGSSKAQWGLQAQTFFKPGGDLKEESRKGIIFRSQPAAFLDGVSWQGVFRQGGSLKVNHNLALRAQDGMILENILKLESQVHFSGDWAAFSVRTLGDAVFTGQIDDAGKEIRGVLNQNLIAYSRGLMNIDLQGRTPLGPVNQALELLLVPFLDAGFFVSTPESPKPSGFYSGTGVELVLVPAFSKTSLIRLSCGWNASGFPVFNQAPEEISLDLSHFY